MTLKTQNAEDKGKKKEHGAAKETSEIERLRSDGASKDPDYSYSDRERSALKER